MIFVIQVIATVSSVFFRARKHVCDCNSNCRHPDADCSWGFFSTKVGSILSVRVVKCLPRRAATTLGGSFSGPFSSAASLVIFSPHFGPISGALSRGLLINKITKHQIFENFAHLTLLNRSFLTGVDCRSLNLPVQVCEPLQ